MIETLSSFHFERPFALLLTLPVLLLAVLEHRRADQAARWRAVIDPELLRYLLVGTEGRSRVTPALLLAAAGLLATLAVAGPAWEREPSPFADAKPPVVIVLKVTPSMLSEDLAPTRLDRARQKLADLTKLREGASTGLVAYAGSSHLVLPPTPDASVVVDLAKALSPDIMPKEGDDLPGAIALAQRVLSGNGHGGSILIMADTIQPGDQPDATAPISVLGMLPLEMDDSALEDAAGAMGAFFVATTSDQSDLTNIAARLDRAGRIAGVEGDGSHWKEAGYWLTPLLALIVLSWFRRGWMLE